jgi:argininosuccinate lyase
MKLWEKKGSDINAQIEKFTVGRDPEFDMVLAKYDVQGSMAHAKMLESVNMLSAEDAKAIQKELKILIGNYSGSFRMKRAWKIFIPRSN